MPGGHAYPVLIAEDNPDDAELLRQAIRLAGTENPVQIVPDGRKAIEYLEGKDGYADRQAFPFPEVIFTDLKMPVVSGFELLEWLRNHPECRVVPLIVLSSSQYDADVKRAYELGANCYLTKPSSLKAFGEMIGQTLRFWEMCTRPEVPVKCD